MANKVGRPQILTPELQQKVCTAIELGNYIETAAAYVGVRKETLYDWMRRGARYHRGDKGSEDDAIFGEFSDAIDTALAKSEVRDIMAVDRGAKKHWQAAAWKLERRFQNRWGRKDNIDIAHSGRIETEVSAKATLLDKLGSMIAQVKQTEQGEITDEGDTEVRTDGGTT